ncbi:MAG: hypothetical protein C0469_10110 [Cyanobacteria bacterium DS2.3.42]|nr:hypothetical protein [Cyanobacteria bacterium DS2.3.42]
MYFLSPNVSSGCNSKQQPDLDLPPNSTIPCKLNTHASTVVNSSLNVAQEAQRSSSSSDGLRFLLTDIIALNLYYLKRVARAKSSIIQKNFSKKTKFSANSPHRFKFLPISVEI